MFFRFAIFLMTVFGVTSCGLPSINTLEPPVNPRVSSINSPGLQVLTFDHNPDNDFDDFKGYDLFYKLYPPPGSSASSAISADESYIETSPRNTGTRRLQARGFVRLISVTSRGGDPDTVASFITDDSPPSIPFRPTSSAITFSLDLRESAQRAGSSIDSDPTETDLVVSASNGSVSPRGFRRRNSDVTGVSRPDDLYESFWYASGYDASDIDISNMFSGTTFDLGGDFNDQLTIVLYAIAFGVDGTDFQPYYSEPLRLSEATVVVSDN